MDVKEVISVCSGKPERFRELDPFQFENVVAELLAGFGWEVSVTPPTRDGGYDILGLTTDASGLQTSWVVECKRYAADKKVGVEIARRIVGVKTHVGVPNAVLVTTSSFTVGAQELSLERQDLHLVDLTMLARWVQEYAPPVESSHTATQTFSSCFISHSSKDSDFARKLALHLRTAGVPVWYAPEDILPGEKIYEQVRKAISSFDRLLVVLSAHSMESNWVRTELTTALAREQEENRRVLFPISLVPIEIIKAWECIDPDSGIDIARELRSYHIPDFSNWSNAREFGTQLKKVITALEESSLGTASTPALFHLKQRLRASYPGDRATAAREIGKLDSAAAPAVPALRKATHDSSEQVRNAAVWALAEIGTAAARKAVAEFESR